jgi:hypothetical protein
VVHTSRVFAFTRLHEHGSRRISFSKCRSCGSTVFRFPTTIYFRPHFIPVHPVPYIPLVPGPPRLLPINFSSYVDVHSLLNNIVIFKWLAHNHTRPKKKALPSQKLPRPVSVMFSPLCTVAASWNSSSIGASSFVSVSLAFSVEESAIVAVLLASSLRWYVFSRIDYY